MGFTTGLLGGVTLTYSLLYLSLYLHRSNRKAQHTILSQQSLLLTSIVDPLPPLPEPPAYDVKTVSLTETMKDRWNDEVEGLVRRTQNIDWAEVRERWEGRIGTVWEKVRAEGGKVGEKASEKGKEMVNAAESEAEKVGKKGGSVVEGEGKRRILDEPGPRVLEEKSSRILEEPNPGAVKT